MKESRENPYALGLTKKEYYKQYEQAHREERNAYRRRKYLEKIKAEIKKKGSD